MSGRDKDDEHLHKQGSRVTPWWQTHRPLDKTQELCHYLAGNHAVTQKIGSWRVWENITQAPDHVINNSFVVMNNSWCWSAHQRVWDIHKPAKKNLDGHRCPKSSWWHWPVQKILRLMTISYFNIWQVTFSKFESHFFEGGEQKMSRSWLCKRHSDPLNL